MSAMERHFPCLTSDERLVHFVRKRHLGKAWKIGDDILALEGRSQEKQHIEYCFT